MLDPKVVNGLAVVSTGYLKRLLEKNVYDNFTSTDIGMRIIALDKKWKYGIELALNVLTVFFDQIQVGNSYFLKVLKQIGLDAAPELSSRIVNGTKGRTSQAGKAEKSEEDAQVLAGLEMDALTDLLAWLQKIEPSERKRIFSQVAEAAKEGIDGMSRLESPIKEYLLRLLASFEQAPDTTTGRSDNRSDNQE